MSIKISSSSQIKAFVCLLLFINICILGACSSTDGDALIKNSVLFQADAWSKGLASPILKGYKGVSFDITNITSSGADVAINNDSKNQLAYSDWFLIDKLEDGEWVRVDFINGGVSQLMIDLEPPSYLNHLDFNFFFGGLSPGTYRFVQGVYVNIGFQDMYSTDPVYLYTEFVVE